MVGILADYSSIIGLVITIVGFFITIVQLIRAKSISESINAGIEEVKKDIKIVEMTTEFTKAISTLEEIRRLQRSRAWPILPDRYTVLRTALILINKREEKLTEQHKITLQSCIVTLKGIEKQIEHAIYANTEPENIDRLNTSLSNINDRINSIKAEIIA